MNVDLISIICGTCGCPHSIPVVLHDTMQREGGHWTCPNGHSRGWDEGTDVKNLKKCKDDLQYSRDRINELSKCNTVLIRQLTIQKGLVTKAKNKLKAK